MNFNCIAPNGKCNDFNVSFKEPIEIDADSKIQFNWAKFSRQAGIVLNADAEFFLRPQRAIPNRIPSTPATLTLNQGNFTLNKFTIPRGKYTAYQLQEELSRQIDNLISASYGSADPPTNGWNTQYYLEHLPLVQRSLQGDDLLIGLIYPHDTPSIAGGAYVGVRMESILPDFNNTIGNTFIEEIVNGVLQLTYLKDGDQVGRTGSTYDNYMMTQEHFFHYGEAELTDRLGGGGDGVPVQYEIFKDSKNWEQLSGFQAESLKDIQEWGARTLSNNGNENVLIGLYSREYATDTNVNNTLNNTAGTGALCPDGATQNPKLDLPDDVNGTILSHLTIELGQHSATNNFYDNIIIRTANKGAGQPLRTMTIADQIVGMDVVYEIRLSDLVSDVGYKPKIFCHTYYKKNLNYQPDAFSTDIDRDGTGYLDEDFLYFRVGLIIEDEDTFEDEFKVIYDSGDRTHAFGNEVGFSQRFFNHFENGANPQNQTEGQVNSQIPFNLIMGAQFNDDGWCDIRASTIDKGTTIAEKASYNANPKCIVRGYQIVAPEWFGDMINPFDKSRVVANQYYSKILYPTPQSQLVWGLDTAITPWSLYIEDITARFRNKDIAVYIDSLPIQNYKNKGSDREVSNNVKGLKKNLLAVCPIPFSDSETTGGAISGFYSPFNQFITQLKNQPFKTNNLRILIKDASTDEPLLELEKAVIDFTIFN